MTEGQLKAKLVVELRVAFPRFVIFRHEDEFTFGIPDISMTGLGKTTWWEAKLADPDFKSQGIQELTMLRLSGAGHARYIIWDEPSKRTFIVHPRYFANWKDKPDIIGQGLRMSWLAEQMGKAHNL